MDDPIPDSLARAFRPRLAGTKVIVFCSHHDEVSQWQRLMTTAATDAVLVLSFDAPPLTELLPTGASRSAPQLVADRHALLATLAADSPLTRLVDGFDPARRACLLITDPLDPPAIGARRRLGGKHPSWAMFEHKSVVDALWDTIGLARPESAVFDQPGTLIQLASPIDVVASYQRRGAAPSAGGGDVRRLTGANQDLHGSPLRVRAMPALAGAPCRLHGLVLTDSVVAFPPLELLVPHRPSDGTFLCTAAWPLPDQQRTGLVELTRWLGDRLGDRLAYRGGFSVDGILTHDGYRPTDLNTRVTSSCETLPPPLRVAVHAAALSARAELPWLNGPALQQQITQAFDEADELMLRTPAPADARPTVLPVRWTDTVLQPARDGADVHGVIDIGQGARGMVVSIRLRRDQIPSGPALQTVAIVALRAADQLLNTGLGPLSPPDAAPPRAHSV